jgi:hemoglobin
VELPVNLTRASGAAGAHATEPTVDPDSVFAAAGGEPFFRSLAAEFYRRVSADPVLLRLYPEPADLRPAEDRLALFLMQYWGGPTTYSDQRGHPRLRMRHAPFVIAETERDHWLAAMTGALDDLGPQPALRTRFDDYFQMSAEAMRNATEATEADDHGA